MRGVNGRVYVALALHVDFLYILANVSCCLSVINLDGHFDKCVSSFGRGKVDRISPCW